MSCRFLEFETQLKQTEDRFYETELISKKGYGYMRRLKPRLCTDVIIRLGKFSKSTKNTAYDEIISSQTKNRIAERVPVTENRKVFFLPHI